MVHLGFPALRSSSSQQTVTLRDPEDSIGSLLVSTCTNIYSFLICLLKHQPEAPWGGKGFFHLTLLCNDLPLREIREGTQSRNLEVEAMKQYCFGFLFMSFSACFLKGPRTTCPKLAAFPVGWEIFSSRDNTLPSFFYYLSENWLYISNFLFINLNVSQRFYLAKCWIWLVSNHGGTHL